MPEQLFVPDVAVLDSVPTLLAVVQAALLAVQDVPATVQESVIVFAWGAHDAVTPEPLQV